MHRDHIWISTLTTLLSLVFTLLVCAPGWSQVFGTNVTGAMTVCGTKNYSQDDPTDSNGSTTETCPLVGYGQAGSVANLKTISEGSVSGTGGSARAASLTYDYLTLTPPSTFHGNKVPITLVDFNTYGIGNSGGTVSFKFCLGWTTPGTASSCTTSTGANGSSSHTLMIPITIHKSTTGFH
jgi:hypothetical protein